MDSIDDIWDAPVLPSSPRPPTEIDSNESDTQVGASRPSKRPRSSLFLPDSDDDEIPASANVRHAQPPRPPTTTDIDINAIFADLDNDEEDPFTFQPLAPALDVETLRRKAEARHKNAILPLTPHAILPSSSPLRDTGDDRDNGKDGDKGKGNDSKGDRPKVRRKVMRLDEGRLLGLTGFPQLIKDTKNFRTKGKGHEVGCLCCRCS
jgi:replication fork protection complex subunit Csm3/Swi3